MVAVLIRGVIYGLVKVSPHKTDPQVDTYVKGAKYEHGDAVHQLLNKST